MAVTSYANNFCQTVSSSESLSKAFEYQGK